ncbi:MAG: tetratricopeptide repeat protein [Halofilum sp. (in: g-proteobacteria)]|nr:tetratricopeptide repeat protein [Halofilum sp. (in: g-proteobacteria)]
MADYATEEEQLEALKRWWRENGRAVLLGATLGVLALAGWRGWEYYTEQRALAASAIYDQLLQGLDERDHAAVSGHAETLRSEYGDTTYAALAAFAAAGLAVEQGELEAAAGSLRWVLDHADDPNMTALARLRLARVREAAGEVEAALALLEAEVPAAYAALYAETRGDMLHEQGDAAGAAAAYQRALDAEVGPASPGLVEYKLNQVRGALPAGATDATDPDS